jgi:RNA polymerase sigma-70 factor (ECF subfamily)
MEDQILLSLIAVQNQSALEAFYDRYVRQVYPLVLSILRDPGIAEEVTQEVFFSVWKRASSFNSERGRPATWLLSVAHHRAIDALRRQRRRGQRETPLEPEIENSHPSEGEGPPEAAMLMENKEHVREALKKLPPEQQRVIILAYFQGLTQVEISERLEQPLGTVKT